MLTNTFVHLTGIGAQKERALWNAGIRSWDDFEATHAEQLPLSFEALDDVAIATMSLSREAFARGSVAFFAKFLASTEHYRIALTYPDETAFVDIETTGFSSIYHVVTLIGVDIGGKYYCWHRGQPLNGILEILSGAKCIVTFNGSLFDIPFLRKHIPDLTIPMARVDLRFLAKRGKIAGNKKRDGKQKKIELALGVVRPDDLKHLDGKHAPELWFGYQYGDVNALRTLIRYNHADLQGMKYIFDACIDKIFSLEKLTEVFVPQRFSTKISRINFENESAADFARIDPPPGKIGVRTTYKHLSSTVTRPVRILGIDLGDSTGLCVLDGNRAETKPVREEAILSETISAAPDLVSIDAPLSLPYGRLRVTHDDPNREQYKDARQCELFLLRKRVGIYACIGLPSMQSLTLRGIALASQIRSLGIPVIESFPGAAQDIFGIPRKGSAYKNRCLSKALAEIGITGEFIRTEVTDDELDAITSALVGLCFWAGQFEALGNEREDYLIIPQIDGPLRWTNGRILGFSGPIAAGKTTAAMHLQRRQGFHYGRFSQILQSILLEQGKAATREALQELGATIHATPGGQRSLGRRLAGECPPDEDLVIDGLRFPEDHAGFVERFGPNFHHIHVDASADVRCARYVKDGHTKAQFDIADHHVVESGVRLVRDFAHAKIPNERGLTEFISKVDALAHAHRP